MIDPAIVDHPKVLRLATELRITRVQVVGHLIAMWGWTATYLRAGSMSGLSWVEIANAARWRRNRLKFVEALRRVGFLDGEDGNLQVHDWQDFQGDIEARRAKDRERKRAQRVQMDSVRNPGGIPEESTSPFPSLPSPTQDDPSRVNLGLGRSSQPGAPDRTAAALLRTAPRPTGSVAFQPCTASDAVPSDRPLADRPTVDSRGFYHAPAKPVPPAPSPPPTRAEIQAAARNRLAQLCAEDPSLEALTAAKSPETALRLVEETLKIRAWRNGAGSANGVRP